ncbi:MAG: glycine cleavage system protein GcvH [Caldilineales bacterium]|nr:glycine cleavage system protein GcvH [Caldilineales bacterium]MCW5856788.1 glycine cleavage system protein GcvH [Caldilineales bacterium]
MAKATKCEIPADLYYWIKEHVWVRREEDGSVTIGMTDAAQHIAGVVINAMPKKAGRGVQKGRSTGTVESGKWVGPVKAPVSGQIIAANETLASTPRALNEDPYGSGWFVRIQPDNWAGESADLVSGADGAAAYRQFLEDEGIACE